MNILNYIRLLILEDEYLKEKVDNRIYFYEVTENADTSDSFIVLTPIYDEPYNLASDDFLAEEYLIQIDVESYNHQKTIDITKRIRKLLWKINFFPSSSKLDTYFEETKRYVMSRRYQGVPKNQYYKDKRIY
ncbi:hypothetical protein [Staphylococcus haemolyticus]|uniref:hypothetical protein n=1 Tax=Staphylococcus haemolyticus TaxID=1283 RepID=UPI00051D3496|nr:hypothetical protein [Staphylococcus haemolyticus]KGJ25382.1 hypothetical protein ES24_09875 [Staphylococcus haemolyticus]KGJ29232.1 hypothetical protein ES23_05630 [Staphylococcus haemolyticus]MCH4326222.1 hypothetical protein [Staphylococcus haemolyticus]MCH4414253.1 hypothetical protein [Staphylococcus haemolyticus]MCH4419063.1 hypothetical protein [Staphylococcus haemolyticus]